MFAGAAEAQENTKKTRMSSVVRDHCPPYNEEQKQALNANYNLMPAAAHEYYEILGGHELDSRVVKDDFNRKISIAG